VLQGASLCPHFLSVLENKSDCHRVTVGVNVPPWAARSKRRKSFGGQKFDTV
jgi:hypothetical protein